MHVFVKLAVPMCKVNREWPHEHAQYSLDSILGVCVAVALVCPV